MTDVGNALKAGRKGILRTSELSIVGTEVRMGVRLTHVAAQKGITIHSARELFDARMPQTIDSLPLASVHVAPAGSILLHEPLRRFQPHIDQRETLVLRIAGRDVALLAERWYLYVQPVTGIPAVPGDETTERRGVPGKKSVLAQPGVLRLAVAFLGERPLWTPLESKYDRDGRTPPMVQVVEPENVRLQTDLGTGSVQFYSKACAVLAALVGMGIALLYVRPQPRFQPGSDVRQESLYPRWMVQQKDYITLTAAGGEWDHGIGYRQMLAKVAAARGLPKATTVWTTTQVDGLTLKCSPRNGRSFDGISQDICGIAPVSSAKIGTPGTTDVLYVPGAASAADVTGSDADDT